MEFLLISESKLKIVLNAEEMKRHKLNLSAERGQSDLRRGFWRILDRAKEEVGFDPEGDKVLIQFYPTEAGCEVFVTKLGILSSASQRAVTNSDKVTLLSKKQSLYSFNSIDDVSAVCRAISAKCPSSVPEGDLYFGSDKYYLLIDEYGKGGETVEFPCVLEYGRTVSDEMCAYVTEHFELLAKKDAVKRYSAI